MMNPFKPITSWKRKDFDPPPSTEAGIKKRFIAELETSHDLQKDIQQLLSDAHEESIDKPPDGASLEVIQAFLVKNLIGVNKRMVALLAVTAYETRITNWWIKFWSCIIGIGTIILVCIEVFRVVSDSSRPYHQDYRHNHSHRHYYGQYYQENNRDDR